MIDATAYDANERISMKGKVDSAAAAAWNALPRRAASPPNSFIRLGTHDGTCLVKRGMDIIGSILLMILLAPVFALTALLIKCNDGGPVLFWQTRMGKQGREFAFPKFRSMRIDAEAVKPRLMRRRQNSVTFKMKNDPRVTWIGRIIRRTSIDELPQLWCVLKGEMSLVGPRPPLPCEVEKYSVTD